VFPLFPVAPFEISISFFDQDIALGAAFAVRLAIGIGKPASHVLSSIDPESEPPAKKGYAASSRLARLLIQN